MPDDANTQLELTDEDHKFSRDMAEMGMVPVAPPPVPATETRSHKQWAEGKAFLPMWKEGGSGAFGPRLNPEYWRYAAARTTCRWEDGRQMTEGQFDAAVLAVHQVQAR